MTPAEEAMCVGGPWKMVVASVEISHAVNGGPGRGPQYEFQHLTDLLTERVARLWGPEAGLYSSKFIPRHPVVWQAAVVWAATVDIVPPSRDLREAMLWAMRVDVLATASRGETSA